MKLTSKEIFEKALKTVKNPDDILELHAKTYEILKMQKERYYRDRLEELLSDSEITDKDKQKIEKVLLKKVIVNDVEYTNPMEEISIKIRQSVQPLSGSLAELCVEYKIQREGLEEKNDYVKRKDHTDFTIYYKRDKSKMHRIEVKNVSLRERATRGLKFDGDSLAGFFNQPNEFTEENVSVIDKNLKQTGGYCYIPIETLESIKSKKIERFKDINKLGKDMKYFSLKGVMP